MKQKTLLQEFLRYTSLNILGMIGLSCYILADTYFISARLGSDGLTALNIALPLFTLINAIGLMIGVGGATRYTICRAQKNDRAADNSFTVCLLTGLILGIIFLLIGQLAAPQLARLLGAKEQIIEMCGTYLKTLMSFAPLFIGNNILIAFMRNDGAPNLAMCGMLIGSLSNVVLDYVLMFPFNMGIFGAALATGLAPAISIAILSTRIARKKNHFHLCFPQRILHRFADACALGASSFITEISSGIVLAVFNLLILNISGNIGVAAYGIVANLALVALAIFTGICQGIQPLISRYHGTGQAQQCRRLLHYSLLLSASIGVLITAAAWIFTTPLVHAFNSTSDATLQQLAQDGMRIYFTGFLFAGINIVSIAFLAAQEHAKQSFFLSIGRGIIFVLLFAVLLSQLLGMSGIWSTFPAAEAVMFVFCIIFVAQAAKKLKQSAKTN